MGGKPYKILLSVLINSVHSTLIMSLRHLFRIQRSPPLDPTHCLCQFILNVGLHILPLGGSVCQVGVWSFPPIMPSPSPSVTHPNQTERVTFTELINIHPCKLLQYYFLLERQANVFAKVYHIHTKYRYFIFMLTFYQFYTFQRILCKMPEVILYFC